MGKKRTSRELLTDAILSLSEKIPVNQISVKMLALESGLCIATFYNHFTDRDALLLWIHQLGHDAIYGTAFFMIMMKFLNHEWDITKEVFAARMEACIPSELKAFINEPTQGIMPPKNKK